MILEILAILTTAPLSKAQIARSLGKTKPNRYLNELMARLVQKEFAEYTIPDKPNSRLQKYRLTAKGRAFLEAA
jgi:ATP-dependent DNA helicase RecG